MKYDVTALGEALIDFTEEGRTEGGFPLFAANPGGAPCNVLSMLKRLGHSAAFIGKVGRDMFGTLLVSALEGAGICTRGAVSDPSVNTTLAFVGTDSVGERSFSFYRENGADAMLAPEDVDLGLVEDARVFHFGTLSLTHPSCRAATERALSAAKASGTLVSLDPNIRLPLWESAEAAKEGALFALDFCDILKISDDELRFVTGEGEVSAGASSLLSRYPGIKLLTVTCGKDGAYAFCGGESAFCPAFDCGKTVDTTGAGDTFCACVLSYVLKNGVCGHGEAALYGMLRFASAAAGLVTTKKGAFASMPSAAEVNALITKA